MARFETLGSGLAGFPQLTVDAQTMKANDNLVRSLHDGLPGQLWRTAGLHARQLKRISMGF
jgi:hypothetical protein